VNLMKSEEETKVKFKIRIENYQVVPINEKTKNKGLLFCLIWGKNSLQFNEILGLEKWLVGNKEDKLVLISYESRVVKMISQYTSKPTAVNYQIHAHLYQSLKEETVTVARPVSTKIRQTISESIQTNDQSTGIGVVMDNFADVVGEIDKLQDRVDSIESLQEKMANILDVVSSHVGIGDNSGNTVLPGFSQMEMVNVIMEKVESIETKLAKVPESNPDNSNQTKLENFEERLSLIEQKLGILSDNEEEEDVENRIVAIEKHLSKISDLEEAVHSINEKVTKLSVICQKLIHQLNQLKGIQ